MPEFDILSFVCSWRGSGRAHGNSQAGQVRGGRDSRKAGCARSAADHFGRRLHRAYRAQPQHLWGAAATSGTPWAPKQSRVHPAAAHACAQSSCHNWPRPTGVYSSSPNPSLISATLRVDLMNDLKRSCWSLTCSSVAPLKCLAVWYKKILCLIDVSAAQPSQAPAVFVQQRPGGSMAQHVLPKIVLAKPSNSSGSPAGRIDLDRARSGSGPLPSPEITHHVHRNTPPPQVLHNLPCCRHPTPTVCMDMSNMEGFQYSYERNF